MAHTRTSRLGPAARPLAVADELDDASVAKASGEVELPLHIRWSGPAITYDLGDRADRARVYEQVLREGTEDDIRYCVQADQLRELFDELVPAATGPASMGRLVSTSRSTLLVAGAASATEGSISDSNPEVPVYGRTSSETSAG